MKPLLLLTGLDLGGYLAVWPTSATQEVCMTKAIDLTNKEFGRLTAVNRGPNNKRGQAQWWNGGWRYA